MWGTNLSISLRIGEEKRVWCTHAGVTKQFKAWWEFQLENKPLFMTEKIKQTTSKEKHKLW